jgi:cytochrome c biogenesis protein CcmG, thiol:disulfide interchange protein DsbE
MTDAASQPNMRRRFGLALPFVIFAALAGLFWYALQGGDPSRLPSALIGKG